MKISFLFFSICLLILVSCSITEEPEIIKLDRNVFSKFNINIWQDYSVNLNDQKSNNTIKNTILQNIDEVTEALKNSPELVGVKYKATISGNTLTFSDFIVVKPSDLDQTKSVEPVGFFNNTVWGCPDGQKLVSRCYNQQCVIDALSDLGSRLSTGETITIHHAGVAGVKICSDVK
jgi:hypothetical protein